MGEVGGKTPWWSGARESTLWGAATKAGLVESGEKTAAGSNSSPPAMETVIEKSLPGLREGLFISAWWENGK